MRPIQKALTFRASSIGDCLMGNYLLDNIHAQFPEAHLGIVVAGRAAMIRDLFAASPYIEIIEANRKNIPGLFRLWREWRGSDAVVTQYAGKVGGTFSFASKLAARILARRSAFVGFRDAARSNFLFDQCIEFDRSEAPAALERKALAALGISVTCARPTLTYIPNEGVLKRFAVEKKKYLVVHLFSSGKGRGLSPEKKRELLQSLTAVLPTTKFLLTGVVSERKELEEAARDTSARVIAGETTLQEMMQLMALSVGVVAVDTGAAHMATQLGVPLVVFSSCLGIHWWGSEQYGATAPITVFRNAAACAGGHMLAPYPPCLNTIDSQVVARAATKLFS